MVFVPEGFWNTKRFYCTLDYFRPVAIKGFNSGFLPRLKMKVLHFAYYRMLKSPQSMPLKKL